MALEGGPGDFVARVRRKPRYVDEKLCTACGTCRQYCPASIPDEYNEGLARTTALHTDYQQAIPAAFHVDESACLFLTRKECKQCERVCLARAIDFKQKPQELALGVGAVILAPGFGRIPRKVLARYGYGSYPDVITGREFERLTSASGPTLGHVLRPSNGKPARRIAFLQCIGARDESCGNGYCASVCCMYAIKEALVAKDHEPDVEIVIYYMDMRTCGKNFDAARLKAVERGVRFVQCRIGSVGSDGQGVFIAHADERGRRFRESFDLVVLAEGLEAPEDASRLARAAGIALNRYDFSQTTAFEPLLASRPGVFVAGAFQGPKDVPESVTDASGAASLAAGLLRAARNSRVTQKTYPPELAPGEEPRVGVFVCSCGTNIGGVVDVRAVADYAAALPGVVFTDLNLYSCAQGTQAAIAEKIQASGVNRVVVAACTPRTHEHLFQETLRNAGLNRSLFEMANIRDHCSWVHARLPAEATAKAKDLVRMAVAKARGLAPLPEQTLPVVPRALVVGGGVAGMAAALAIAGQGFECFLVEKELYLGGAARRLRFLIAGQDPQRAVEELAAKVLAHPLIRVFLGAGVEDVGGYVGNFVSTVSTNGRSEVLTHGAAVLATGGNEYAPTQYLYGQSPRVCTQLEFEALLAEPAKAAGIRDLVMIQCVGSRGADLPYCSKVCCGQAVKNALRLLELNPRATITVLFRDMRTYGFMEDEYQRAREHGVLFAHFPEHNPPRVEQNGDGLSVTFHDRILCDDVVLEPDLVVLSVGVVPSPVEDLARKFKVPVAPDGFFLEAHPKLRPVDFAVDGVFLCGMAHGPKPIPEAIAQAEAAAGRACIPLARGFVSVEPIVSRVDREACIGCGLCERLCPYAAIRLVKEDKRKKAESLAASCKGCGICASHCPAMCISMGGFTNEQILAQIRSFAEGRGIATGRNA